jgi:PAS domain S-box-containing protein
MSLVQDMGERVLRAAHGRGLAVIWLIVAVIEVTTTLIFGINDAVDRAYVERSFILLILFGIGLKVVDAQFVYLSLASELMELSDDALVCWRLDSRTGASRIEFWSEGAERLYGYSPREALGKNIHDLLKSEFPIPLGDIVTQSLHNGWSGKIVQTRKDGTKLTVASQWVRRRFGVGNPKRSISILECNTDITQIEKQTELEASLEVRDEFLAVASHELRTPVTVLNGYAQLLERASSRQEQDERTLRRAIDMLVASAKRVTLLVNQLLDVSRINTGRFRLNRGYIDVMPLFRAVVETATQSTSEHRICLKGPDVLPAYVDPTHFQQVVQNLLNNAMKYSPDGGDISVDVELVTDNFVFRVRDHGIGLSPEHTERIFERYYRVRQEHEASLATDHYGGLGIGLYVSRQIVELHGGSIRAQPAEDGEGGTEVLVAMPLTESAEVNNGMATILGSRSAA